MADIAVTAAQVAPVFPTQARVRSRIAAEALTRGQPVYYTSTGKAGIADANASGKQQFRGIALETVGTGAGVSILEEGECYGFTLSGVAYDGLVYLSDTAGSLGETAGTMTVQVGRCVGLSDPDITKVLYVSSDTKRNWS